jgi:sarcosine oxidase subunit gamma
MIQRGASHVVDLMAKTPAEGLLPVTMGGLNLREVALGVMTSLAPFKDQDAQVEKLLGGVLPKVGRSVSKTGQEVVWFSQGQYLVIGGAVDMSLAEHAALTDQSDAWCAITLEGVGSEAVLARLVPVDLREVTFKRGHALRSQLGHMPLHITRKGKDAFRLMTFRSMAGTMVHEVTHKIRLLSARG